MKTIDNENSLRYKYRQRANIGRTIVHAIMSREFSINSELFDLIWKIIRHIAAIPAELLLWIQRDTLEYNARTNNIY